MERLNNARAAGRLLLSAVGAVFPLPTLVSEVQPSDKRVQRRVGAPPPSPSQDVLLLQPRPWGQRPER